MRNLCMNVVRTDYQSSTVPVCLSFVCPPPLLLLFSHCLALFESGESEGVLSFAFVFLFYSVLHAALWTLHRAEDLTNCTVDQLRDIASLTIHLDAFEMGLVFLGKEKK